MLERKRRSQQENFWDKEVLLGVLNKIRRPMRNKSRITPGGIRAAVFPTLCTIIQGAYFLLTKALMLQPQQ
jgi:hypothetical protein